MRPYHVCLLIERPAIALLPESARAAMNFAAISSENGRNLLRGKSELEGIPTYR